MPSSFGTSLRVTVFGQSHSAAIGCVIEGLPAGEAVDSDALAQFMARRAPGHTPWSTPRKEADNVRILSGLNTHHRTCGAPLALMIENTNTRPGDYESIRSIPRPGHADWTAEQKWGGEQDASGGGHFSGRLTAPICAAGGIALQLLARRGVQVAAHLFEVAGIRDTPFLASEPGTASTPYQDLTRQIADLGDGRAFPALDTLATTHMQTAIAQAHKEGDSVGGVIECVALNLPAGIGSPLFDGIESTLARVIFGIPAVKGLEFGAGFAAATRRGSQNNDPYQVAAGSVIPSHNAAGGNLGGITTGAPLLFRVAIKPTPSISQAQDSVNLISGESATLKIHGRHDPCIAPRAVPVMEAVCGLAVLDSWLAWPPEAHPERQFAAFHLNQ